MNFSAVIFYELFFKRIIKEKKSVQAIDNIVQAIDNIALAPNFPPRQLLSNNKLSAAIFRINETVQV